MAHTILHWNGFDSGNDLPDDYSAGDYQLTGGAGSGYFISGFFGFPSIYGYGRYMGVNGSVLRLMPQLAGGPFTAMGAQLFYGIATTGLTNQPFLRFWDLQNGSEQISLRLNWNGSSYDLRVQRGSTILGTLPSFITPSQWFWISAMVYVDDAAGVVKLRSGLNDQIVFSFTGDTMNTTLQAIHAVELGIPTNATQVADDFVISSCAPSDDPMFRYRVLGAEVPSANDVVGCSVFGQPTNYQAVSEIPPNGDTSYVYTSAPGTKDTYSRVWTSFTNTPLAVRVEARARRNDAGVRTLRNILKRGSTEFQGTAQVLDNGYKWLSTEWTQDPLSGDAWRPGRFNSADMKLGFKIE
jgi:hypothetical protein